MITRASLRTKASLALSGMGVAAALLAAVAGPAPAAHADAAPGGGAPPAQRWKIIQEVQTRIFAIQPDLPDTRPTKPDPQGRFHVE